jgi:DNA-binding transcriptional ArsR family regulator
MVTYSPQVTFNALADPTRRAVLDMLRSGSLPAGRIARAFPVSRPAISKHLRFLRRARLVRERRDGRLRVYELNASPLRVVDSWISQYRAFWEVNLRSLKTFVEAEHARKLQASIGKKNSAARKISKKKGTNS